MSELKDLDYYSKRIKKLRVDRSRGTAPYQPLLLLALFELVEQEIVTDNRFPVSPELISIFIKYRNRLSLPKFKADPAQPFYHMSKPKLAFWHLQPKPGHDLVVQSKSRLNTLQQLRDHIEYGFFDTELFELLQNPVSRNALIAQILQVWFPNKTEELQKIFEVNSFEQLQLKLKEQGGAVYSVGEIKQEEDVDSFVRDAAFRRNVIALYNQQCAFCRLRIVGRFNEDIVDGAHIKPFATFRDNRYTNGLALCKNHHWAFDRGWFSIDNNYKIVVSSERFKEDALPNTRPMRAFGGEKIALPEQERFFPSFEALEWHREYWKIAA
ncbi:MAG: HNH endonuclease [Cyanobacteria bacterium J06648_16]